MQPKDFFNSSKNKIVASIRSAQQAIARFRFNHVQKSLDRRTFAQVNKHRFPSLQQLKHLHKVLSAREKKIIQISLSVTALGLALWGYGYFMQTELIAKTGGEYTEGLVGSPLYINPLLSQTNDVDQDLVRLVFNGLVRYNDNYEIIPDLAESWTISEDRKQYTFVIRNGVKWHDGEPFTVNDVLFTFQAIKDKNFKSPLNLTFEGVTAEITGERQITFTLTEPYAGFLNLLTFGILPQHLWFDIPAVNSQLATYNQKPIGTGPFKFKSLLKEKNGSIVSYTFERYDGYHLQPAYISALHFKFYPDAQSAVDALKNKHVQGLGFISKKNIGDISNKTYNLHEFYLSQFTAVFFNEVKNEVLKDAKVREALQLATNKEQILSDVLQGQGNIIHSPVLPGFLGFDESIVTEFNPARAAELLIADGWGLKELELNQDGTLKVITDEETATEETSEQPESAESLNPVVPEEKITQEILVKKETPLVLTLTTIDQPDSVKLVTLLKEQWEAIGVKVLINLIDRRTFGSQTIPTRDYEVLVYGGIIGYDGDLFPYWHSSQREYPGVNLANYVNRNVDARIEEVRKESNPETQATKLQEIQKLITEQRPAIFLYSPTYTYPVSKSVKGITTTRINLPSDRFWDITDWYIKTKRLFR